MAAKNFSGDRFAARWSLACGEYKLYLRSWYLPPTARLIGALQSMLHCVNSIRDAGLCAGE